jgi:hypothetical protein
MKKVKIMIGRIGSSPIQYYQASATAVLTKTAPAYGAGVSIPAEANPHQAIPSSASTLKNNAINSGPQKTGDKDCKTCQSRKYQDGSDDPGVSMKSPTHLSTAEAGAAVSAHENEHVVREQAKAAEEGREVVAESVRIFTAVCPECGKTYVSGGETTVVTRKKPDEKKQGDGVGKLMDFYA